VLQQKIKFKPLDFVIILIVIAVGIFFYYRITVQMEYDSNWKSIPRYLVKRNAETGNFEANYLLEGLFTTIRLAIWSTIFGTVLGVIFGVFRTTKILFLRMVGRAYVELIRNLPPLVLIFIFYYFASGQLLPLLGVEEFIRSQPEQTQRVLAFFFAEKQVFTQFVSGIITIGVFEGSYITEIIRSGIDSIERGQREAGYSLGLSWWDQMRYIIMPQAFKQIIPPLGNEFINTIKRSSIVAAISIQELTFQGLQLAMSTMWVFEVWITVAIMYFVVCMLLSLGVSALEKRMHRSD